MIGAHILIYSSAPERDRQFLTDVLQLKSVDAGHGWLIFKLPPAELAVHPVDEDSGDATAHSMLDAHLYLMCDDLERTMKDLAKKGVQCGDVSRERWGMRTTIRLPSGGTLGLYQPAHPTALGL
jgi:glyoxalase/bleomycin resistance protein/dioxygenase superfamily protein